MNYTPIPWLKSYIKSSKFLIILSILWLLLISWLAFLWNLGNTGLVDETEPLFAEASRQITVTGDWITPYFNGETRFDKPILIYWLMAIAYKIIGVNEWAVRLPSALSAIALMGLAFYTLLHFGFPSPAAGEFSTTETETPAKTNLKLWFSATLGATLIALNLETIAWARTGVSDMLLTSCMDGALLAFFLGYAQPSNTSIKERWYITFYILIALAVLTKGPVGIVLPGFIITAFLIYIGRFWQVLAEMRIVRGGLIMAVITLPWYILVTWANGETFINSFFGYHNLERFTGVVNHHSATWYFYFLVVLLGFAPWSIYLPMAMIRLRFWQRDNWINTSPSTQLSLFAFFWFAGVFGFFSIAVTKLPSYLLPLMPASAILVALLFSREMSSGRIAKENFKSSIHNKGIFGSGIFNLVFVMILTGALLYLPNFLGYDPAVPNLHQIVLEAGLSLKGSIIWGSTAIGLIILLLKRQWHWLWSVNVVGFMAFIIFWLTPAFFIIDQSRQLPLRELAVIVSQVKQPQEELIMLGFKKPSVVFYSHKIVNYIRESDKAMDYVRKKFEKSHVSDNSNQSESTSVLILGKPEEINDTGLKPNQYQNLANAGAYQLIRFSK